MAKIYGLKEAVLTVGGRIVTGYAADAGWMFEYDVDHYAKVVDSHGDTTRVKTANFNGKLTINLLQSSEMNDYFMSLVLADQASNGGVVPIFGKDTNGTTLITIVEAWVMKTPSAQFQEGMQNRVWTFDTGQATVYLGGSTALKLAA